MANDFIALPAPAANGAGAWIDCSAMGGLRTIIAITPDAFVTIECSNQLVAANPYPVTAFQANGETTVQVAAHWMRAVVSNFAAGGAAPIVNVGSTGDGTTTDQLATTAGNGVAAATDTTALPAFKTIQVTGGFTGSLNIEISEDAGTTYATAFSFSNGGSSSGLYVADRMRVRRIGVVPGGAMPQVWVGATAPPGGSGGGGGGSGSVAVDQSGTPVVVAATTLNFVGATVTDAGGGEATITISGGGGGGVDVLHDDVTVLAAAAGITFNGANISVIVDGGDPTHALVTVTTPPASALVIDCTAGISDGWNPAQFGWINPATGRFSGSINNDTEQDAQTIGCTTAPQSGTTVHVAVAGPLTLTAGQWHDVNADGTNLVPGIYYLADTGAGTGFITAVKPTTSGWFITVVGYAVSTTVMIIRPEAAILIP